MTAHETREFGDDFVLIIQHKDWTSRKYFPTYDDLNNYAIFLQFSSYVARCRALERKSRRWVELFRF